MLAKGRCEQSHGEQALKVPLTVCSLGQGPRDQKEGTGYLQSSPGLLQSSPGLAPHVARCLVAGPQTVCRQQALGVGRVPLAVAVRAPERARGWSCVSSKAVVQHPATRTPPGLRGAVAEGWPRGRGAASPPGHSRAELQSPSRCGTSEQGLAVLKSLPVTCNKRDALILHALNACISIFGVFNLLITHFLLIL